jgi:N-acyl-D-amino-acid deacylase
VGEGSTVAAAAEQAGLDEAAFVCTILAESRLDVGVILGRDDFDEEDVRALTRHDAFMASSDGIFVGRYAHPRGWGSFARYLGRHVRELGDLSWVEAVRHLSTGRRRSLRPHRPRPAGAGRRGGRRRLPPGRVVDRATYEEPRVVAEGMVHVLVNGVPVLRDRRCHRRQRRAAACDARSATFDP